MTRELVWLPESGMGYYPVTEPPEDVYDAAYWAKYEGYAETEMGRELLRVRMRLVGEYVGDGEVLDVGIGCGTFVEARPNTIGFDVAPTATQWLRERSLFVDPYLRVVDAATFWDSLEHIPDAHRILANVREWVFCSLPLVPGDGPPPTDWKHLRPDEHCWYWTRRGFATWMGDQGFRCVEYGTEESKLGREDIGTFVFRREERRECRASAARPELWA